MAQASNHLTAPEVGVLWAQYVNATLTNCMYQYFIVENEDKEIGEVLDSIKQITQHKIQRISGFLESDNYPVPIGFTGSDVNTNAARLYSDLFHLSYVRCISRLGLTTYGLALTACVRQDVRTHFIQCINDLIQIDQKAVQVQQSKGLLDRFPYISPPEKAEYIQDTDFFGSFFGSQRPLSAIEIANIFLASQMNMLTKALLMGFAQTAEAKDLRKFFLRGKEIADKHIKLHAALLGTSDMPLPASLDAEITSSTVAPFSDKLMLQHTILANQAALTYYGTTLSFLHRIDISGSYVRLMTESLQYLEDALMLMIRHKWMEQPPMSADRRALVLR
ncbi:MAG: DUF3231 family protein [Pelosinus sp.]|nr:DUF3231 family protein [Pelosinus sp.]